MPQIETLSQDVDFIELVKINQTITSAVFRKRISLRTFENVAKHQQKIKLILEKPLNDTNAEILLNELGLEKKNMDELLSNFAKHVKLFAVKYPSALRANNFETISQAIKIVEDDVRQELVSVQQTDTWWDRNYCSDCAMANCDYCFGNGPIPESGGGLDGGARINPMSSDGSVGTACRQACLSIRNSQLNYNRYEYLIKMAGCIGTSAGTGAAVAAGGFWAGPLGAGAGMIAAGGTFVACGYIFSQQYMEADNIAEQNYKICIIACPK